MATLRTLSLYEDYRCANRGACCASGWPIPLETPADARVRSALAEGRFAATLARAGTTCVDAVLPRPAHDADTTILPIRDGRCVFHDVRGARCDLQDELDLDALPSACRHFPRVCRIAEDVIDVTFSHYCPTVAERLLAPQNSPVSIVERPASCPPTWVYEGQDVRDTLPPLLHATMLMDVESYRVFEASLVRWLGTNGLAPETTLAAAADVVERLRGWTPGADPLVQRVRDLFEHVPLAALRDQEPTFDARRDHDVSAAVRSAVPPDIRRHRPLSSEALREAYDRWLLRTWPAFSQPASRYVAAKAFGNWIAYSARGLRIVLAWLEACLSVLKTELARQCAVARRPLDAEIFIRGVREADLLMVHLVRLDVLRESLWSGIEPSQPARWRGRNFTQAR